MPAAISLTGGFLLLQTLFRLATSALNTDVVWNVQVLHRLLAGEALYRDVFYGSTPLSIYLLQFLTSLNLGAEGFLVILVSILSQITVLALCFAIANRLGIQQLAGLGLWILVVGFPWLVPSYTPVAMVFLVLTGFIVLVVIENPDANRKLLFFLFFAAGAAAALSFCAKQNLGLMALVGASISFANLTRNKSNFFTFFPIMFLFAGFCSVVLLCLFPVITSGSFDSFVDYNFIGKTDYLSLSGLSFFGELMKEPNLHNIAVFLLPIVCVLLCVHSLVVFPAKRGTSLTLLLFALAAIANAFPRADVSHINSAVPFLLTISAVSLSRSFQTGKHSNLWIPVILLPALILIASHRKDFYVFFKGDVVISEQKHLRWLPLPKSFVVKWRQTSSRLPPSTGRNAFLLFADASKYYLGADIENPTPFDYPLATTYGVSGEQKTIEMIRKGDIKQVVVGSRHPEEKLNSKLLLDFVELEMEEIEKNGPYTLHTLREGK